MKDVFIFDMDGVLVETESIYAKLTNQLFSSLGTVDCVLNYDDYVGMTSLRMWSQIKILCNIKTPVEALIKQESDLIAAYLDSSDLKPIEGIERLLNLLRAQEKSIAIASSSPVERILLIIRKLNIQEYFDFLISGEEVKDGKPAPDIYLAVADHFRQPPSNCMVIEDSTNGVRAAKAAGMYCIGYLNLHSGNQDLSKADLVIKDFNELDVQKLALNN